MYTLRIQVCPEKGINPTILLWGWDWALGPSNLLDPGRVWILRDIYIRIYMHIFVFCAPETWSTCSTTYSHLEYLQVTFCGLGFDEIHHQFFVRFFLQHLIITRKSKKMIFPQVDFTRLHMDDRRSQISEDTFFHVLRTLNLEQEESLSSRD